MRRACAVVALLAAALFTSVLLAPSAFAHATLTSADPADGDRLDAAPQRVELTFSEPVSLSNGYLRVTDENGDRVDDGNPKTVEGSVSVGLRADLPDGSFLISYRLISADSHPIAGASAFVVGSGPLVAASDAEVGSVSDPAVGVLFSVVRWLSYAALVLLVGPLVIAGLCSPAAWRVPMVGRLFRVGVAGSIVIALVSVIVEALYVSGAPATQVASIDLPGILGTMYGMAMLARIVLVAALALLVGRAWGRLQSALGDRRAPAKILVPVAGALVGIALTYSLSGHPIASTIPALSVTSDMIHVLSMSVWLGGLVVLVGGLLPRRDAGLLAAVLPRFSTLALISISALLVSGSVQAVLEITPLAALWSTSYGLLVTLKVIGFAVIVGLGNVARTWVRARYAGSSRDPDVPDEVPADRRPADRRSGDRRPGGVALAERRRTEPDRSSFARLRRSLLLEVGVAATVLALAAVLVATVPARTAFAQPYAGSLALPDGGSVELTLEPARSGANLMHVYLLDEAGQPLEVQELTGTAVLPAQELGPLEIPLQPTGPGHFTAAGFSLPMAGLWELTLNLRLSEFDAATVIAEVPVS